MKYGITKVFRSIQGEGHFVGAPMTFVRLGGCSVLDCAIRAECDEAPWKVNVSMDEVAAVALCKNLAPTGIVCITGGEPSDWDLVPLIAELRFARYRVHMETSGARLLEGIPTDWLTVSPKTADFKQRVGHVLKVIWRPGMTWAEVRALSAGTDFFHRYLQPLTRPDGSSNIQEVSDAILGPDNRDGEWMLSTQAHKTWGLP